MPKSRPGVCPYCSVGCATLIHTIDGKIINIEGDPRSPVNEGTLCPKGAAIYQLHVNPNRPTQVLHRAPGATQWEVWDLERAMQRVAELECASQAGALGIHSRAPYSKEHRTPNHSSLYCGV